jgi:hypothetical protein
VNEKKLELMQEQAPCHLQHCAAGALRACFVAIAARAAEQIARCLAANVLRLDLRLSPPVGISARLASKFRRSTACPLIRAERCL